MKRIILIALVSFLTLSGAALARQAGEQKKSSPMQGMMEQMMGGETAGGGIAGVGGMMGMMGQITKMMDQCTAMMGSSQSEAQGTKEGQQK